ncbi:translation initiation factor IF-2 [Candidatus Kaiserbacteria bacterium]|nr:translation initiation factor IF-2 [Candidatus Kaiserbacteria bacterium]
MSKPTAQAERPPIVVVMGHVDHGKSTLLDFIRKSNTVAKEAGGITQHVAAYEVERPSTRSGQTKRITFIDTPGHAAFQTIRARGANVADIAILVVAADDGVKPQTLEALQSIKGADIPYIVAINKIDKPNANVERTQASLMQEGVYLEKLGGDVPWAAISAKVGTGVEELLDLILLVAEVHELKGGAEAPASGFVIEAHRDPKRGLAATLIITSGTLRSGMTVVAGRGISPVRIMETTGGVALREASFSTPVQLVGFDELPDVGAEFLAFKGKREAEEARSAASETRVKEGKAAYIPEEHPAQFSLPLIVRADTSGSLEAIEHETVKLGDEHASVRIVQSGIGAVSENDVKAALAGSVQAVVIGFNVKVDPIAEEHARQHMVRVETFDIIYKLTERVEELLHQTRPKRLVEEIVGKAKVLKQFSSRKDQHVVGGSVAEGYLARGASVRVLRRRTLIGVGKIKNIQSHKADVERVESGSEFGALIVSPFEVVQGDTLECFTSAMK